jgi:hypothetical protein
MHDWDAAASICGVEAVARGTGAADAAAPSEARDGNRAEGVGEDELDGRIRFSGPCWDACHALKEEAAFVPSLF